MKPNVTVRQKDVKNIIGSSKLGSGGFCANPYTGCEHACKYCYAAFMDRYSGHTESWGQYVDVKQWDGIGRPERLRGKSVFLSSVTDPYQPAEAQYGRTRELLEQISGSGCRLSILTKSDLVLRDLDLIRTFPEVQVAWSVNTLDEEFRADMDEAASIERRLTAMQTFHEAGVRTACFVAPIFPCITDVPALLEAVRGRCGEVWLDKLNLRGPNRQVILAYIREKWPGFLPLYEAIYLEGDRSYWENLSGELADYLVPGAYPVPIVNFMAGRRDRSREETAGGQLTFSALD